MELELRSLTRGDLDAAFELDRLAFDAPAARREAWIANAASDPARFLGFFAGERLAAMLAVHGFGQFFGGRSVPMGGVSSVATAPEHRGRGLAKRLLAAELPRMRERGEVISALHPASTALYRGLGWEVAGAYAVRHASADTLRSIAAPADKEVRLLEKGDLPAVRACYRRFARGVNGFVDRDDARWAWLTREEDRGFAYVSPAGDGEVDGYVLYRHADRPGPGFRIEVFELVADHEAVLRALWRLVASSGTVARELHYHAPPEDPLLLLMPEQRVSFVEERRWMLRIVDAPGAVAARGFPPGLAARIDLELDDPWCDWNRGPFTLRLSGGEARLERPADPAPDPLRLGIGSFASLYTGWATTHTLAHTGRLHGGTPETRASLDATFAGPTPWMTESF